MFFSWEKHVEIALRYAQDNLDIKKVLAPSKDPAKRLIMCFSRIKNIKSLTSKNSGTLIVITFALYNQPEMSQSRIIFLFWGRSRNRVKMRQFCNTGLSKFAQILSAAPLYYL
jgi:hypothetical protein